MFVFLSFKTHKTKYCVTLLAKFNFTTFNWYWTNYVTILKSIFFAYHKTCISASFCCPNCYIFKHPWDLRRNSVTIWPKLLLYWQWVDSLIKTGGFWEPVRGIPYGGSWVVIHMMEHSPVCRVVNKIVLRKR